MVTAQNAQQKPTLTPHRKKEEDDDPDESFLHTHKVGSSAKEARAQLARERQQEAASREQAGGSSGSGAPDPRGGGTTADADAWGADMDPERRMEIREKKREMKEYKRIKRFLTITLQVWEELLSGLREVRNVMVGTKESRRKRQERQEELANPLFRNLEHERLGFTSDIVD